MSKMSNYQYVPACSTTASHSSNYTLLNRQQPVHARISTNSERDRRPIDPPPIVQIKLNNATPQQIDAFHQSSYFYMCANLAHPTDDNEIYTPTHNVFSGQTVSSMYKLKDVNNQDGAFFIFGDLSVKVEGAFRLKLTLFEITSTGSVCLQSIFTSPFIVYPSKSFPGALDSTFLSRLFSGQGARIKIRKENKSQTVIQRKRKPDQPLVVPITRRERKSSLSSTDGSEMSSHSPVPFHCRSPRITLPPLSPPHQFFDKLHTNESPIALQSIFPNPPSPPLVNTSNFTTKLPPIRQVISTEQVAMMQLSHSEPTKKKLFI